MNILNKIKSKRLPTTSQCEDEHKPTNSKPSPGISSIIKPEIIEVIEPP
jgi:hypothetical protein